MVYLASALHHLYQLFRGLCEAELICPSPHWLLQVAKPMPGSPRLFALSRARRSGRMVSS